jgi:Sigma-70, region 4
LRLERRRKVFDLIVSGYPHEQIAAKMGISIATVRREIDVALAARPPDSADRYVGLQLARLHKALCVVDLALEGGDLRAVPALAALFGQFDRYHGLAALLSAQARGAVTLQDLAPKTLESPDR